MKTKWKFIICLTLLRFLCPTNTCQTVGSFPLLLGWFGSIPVEFQVTVRQNQCWTALNDQLDIDQGTKTWSLRRLFSFSIGWLSGFILVFGVPPKEPAYSNGWGLLLRGAPQLWPCGSVWCEGARPVYQVDGWPSTPKQHTLQHFALWVASLAPRNIPEILCVRWLVTSLSFNVLWNAKTWRNSHGKPVCFCSKPQYLIQQFARWE